MQNFEEFINEAMADKSEVDLNKPVMYSIYGNHNGPWYFGYLCDGEIGVTGAEGGQITYPKLIVDFDKFDAKNLKNNVKNNLVK